jgi:putative transposase
MAKPLSNDLRQRIVDAVGAGSSRNGAAGRFGTAPSTAIRLIQRFEATGSIEPGKMGGHLRPKLEPHKAVVEALLRTKPDITLLEMKEALAKRRIVAGKSTISRFLIALGNSFKKNGSRQRARPSGR